MTVRCDDRRGGDILGEIRVGTCSWADRELRSSGWYPRNCRDAAARLGHYASFFDTVEVDSTFYAFPKRQDVYRWIAGTPRGFLFNIKVFGLFTLHRFSPAGLPSDFRSSVKLSSKNARLPFRAIPRESRLALWDYFKELIAPLDDTARLGYLLFQLPPWFHCSDRGFLYLERVREVTLPFKVAVEVRHRSWLEEPGRERFMSFLRDQNMAYVAVDEPPLPWTVPPEWPVTATWGTVLRLHGRNVEGWSKKGATVEERFRYDYGGDELKEWAEPVLARSAKVPRTFVMFNNCYRNNAIRNAAAMKPLVGLPGSGEGTGRQVELFPDRCHGRKPRGGFE